MEVAQRHHGYPGAHQCVVGIIPFGSLRIHPNPATGYKIRQLGEDSHQQFFEQIDLIHLIAHPQQPPVRPLLGYAH